MFVFAAWKWSSACRNCLHQQGNKSCSSQLIPGSWRPPRTRREKNEYSVVGRTARPRNAFVTETQDRFYFFAVIKFWQEGLGSTSPQLLVSWWMSRERLELCWRFGRETELVTLRCTIFKIGTLHFILFCLQKFDSQIAFQKNLFSCNSPSLEICVLACNFWRWIAQNDNHTAAAS